MRTGSPGLHSLHLRLLEIGGDPDVVQRDQNHQGLAGLYPVTEFHGLAPDDAAHGSVDLRIAEVQPRGAEFRRSLLAGGRWRFASWPSHRQPVAAPSATLRLRPRAAATRLRACGDLLLARPDGGQVGLDRLARRKRPPSGARRTRSARFHASRRAPGSGHDPVRRVPQRPGLAATGAGQRRDSLRLRLLSRSPAARRPRKRARG